MPKSLSKVEFSLKEGGGDHDDQIYIASFTCNQRIVGTARFAFKTVRELEVELGKRRIAFEIKSLSSASSGSMFQPNSIIPTNVPANLAIDSSFSNSKLRKLLESDLIVPGMIKTCCAEERLRAALLQKSKTAARRTLGDKYQGDDVTFVEVRRRNASLSHSRFNNPEDNLGEMIERALEYCAKNSDAVSDKYADICDVLADLLETPSLDNLDKLVKLASEVKGHPDWIGVVRGIVMASVGVISISSAVGLSVVFGLANEPFFMVLLALVGFGAIVGGGIGAKCASTPSAHSAELYKVETAAKELPELKASSFSFSRVFSRKPKECVVHENPLYEEQNVASLGNT